MIASGGAQLLVAHPAHELLLHGWICQSKPIVQVLTDGSGHSAVGRLELTAEFLRAIGAPRGAIFGRLSDRQAYAMILECQTTLLRLVMDLAEELGKQRPKIIVTDAAEGYNPVHDLCRMIAGAAIELAAVETQQYEYAVVNSPDSFDAAMTSEAFVVELDDAALARKIDRARHEATRVADINELLSLHGTEVYRRERFQRVVDWTSIDLEPPPLYERFGEQRVAAHRYSRVIRRAEHMVPLRDALRAAVEKRSCVF